MSCSSLTSPHLAAGPWLAKLSILALTAILCGVPAVLLPDAATATVLDEKALAGLPAEHRDWLKMVDLLLTREERDYFLSMTEEFRRRSFIEAFWDERDSFPDTHTHELRRDWEKAAEYARLHFEDLMDARSRVHLLKGEPLFRCRKRFREREDWYYPIGQRTLFVLTMTRNLPGRPYELWTPNMPLRPTLRQRAIPLTLVETCDFRPELMRWEISRLCCGEVTYETSIQDFLEPPPPPSKEWVSTFKSFTTDLPEVVDTFDIDVETDFLGKHQNRTVMQGIIAVPAQLAMDVGSEEQAADHHFLLTGEIVRDDELFEAFRYRYELSAKDTVPIVFQRYLRPGPATLLLKVEDLSNHHMARAALELDVPKVDFPAAVPQLGDSPMVKLLAEANRATADGERLIRLIPPPGVIHTGLIRFNTFSAGEFSKVQFFLNDQLVMTKLRPPFSLELDVGTTPAIHRLRVSALDEQGIVVADDEILINPGSQRFRTRLIEPRAGESYQQSVRAVAEVLVPEGDSIDRLELFLNEDRVATLYQPPFSQPIILPQVGMTAYVRAVTYLADGSSSEDLVFINAPDFSDAMDIHLVELYASVFDESEQPIFGLGENDFIVFEDERRQEIQRFEWIENLPIHAGLLIDTSASMEDSLDQVTDAARTFLYHTVQPEDRFAILTFSNWPNVVKRFTHQVEDLSRALDGLKAEGGTALYDSLVFALHYFQGIHGRKALLLLSDGEDETSLFDFEGAHEFAHRADVVIYAIGLKEASRRRSSRKVLRQLAAETGGRSFFIDDLEQLPGIYAMIQQELRSQYLIAYQSDSTKNRLDFRRVTVRVEGKGREVRTISGYYPQ